MGGADSAREWTAKLNIDTVFRWHLVIIAMLITAHIGVFLLSRATGFVDLNDVRKNLDMDSERSVANLSSAFAIAICALVALAVSFSTDASGSKLLVRGWLACAAIMLFIAVDEGAAIHDSFSAKVGPALGFGEFHGVLRFGWVVPYSVVVIVVLVGLARFAFAIPSDTRNRLAAAAILYVCAALGMELPAAWIADQVVAAGGAAGSDSNLVVVMIMHAIEEGGEMLAVALTLRALLLHIIKHLPRSTFALSSGSYVQTADPDGRA